MFRSKILLALVVLAYACHPTQSQQKELLGIEITPGCEWLDTSFFEAFETEGMVHIRNKKGKSKPFRYIQKKMDFFEWEGKQVIRQRLDYANPNRQPSGTHTTYYDPSTFGVLYWAYTDHKTKAGFAFRMDGTTIKGTQDPNLLVEKWQSRDIGVQLFQNETRELLLRAIQIELGQTVRFPVIGMQVPFYGWVSYTYLRDEKLDYEGKSHPAKIWASSTDPNTYYAVIEIPPYVIKREVSTGKETHIFTYDPVQ